MQIDRILCATFCRSFSISSLCVFSSRTLCSSSWDFTLDNCNDIHTSTRDQLATVIRNCNIFGDRQQHQIVYENVRLLKKIDKMLAKTDKTLAKFH